MSNNSSIDESDLINTIQKLNEQVRLTNYNHVNLAY